MVAIRLESSALDYVAARLADAGGLAGAFRPELLRDPITFAPEDTDPEALENFEWGGIAAQAGADSELSMFVQFLKKRNGRLRSVLFDDPWSTPGDQDYDGPPPEEMIVLGERVGALHDIAAFSPDLIWQFRANAVSHLKIIYVIDRPADLARALIEEDPAAPKIATHVRHIAVNAYEDESWVLVNHAPG